MLVGLSLQAAVENGLNLVPDHVRGACGMQALVDSLHMCVREDVTHVTVNVDYYRHR